VRTGRTRGTLLSRLERLELRTAEVSCKVRFQLGHLKRLPEDYVGERHIVVAKELPSQNGQEWVEFEEVPGPDPNPPLPQQPHRHGTAPSLVSIMFV
jgi:hypothetical protein